MKHQKMTRVAALFFCLSAAVAQAQYYQLPEGAGLYFRLGLGPSFWQNGQLTEFGGPVSSPVKYRTGLASDAAIGYAFNKYLATDFELGFVGAEIDNVPGYSSVDSYIYNVPFLANVTLSYPIPRSIVTPYIGAGVGGADVVFDTAAFGDNAGANIVFGNEDDVVFAWQAFAGLRFRLNPQMSLGIGYKFLATDNPTFTYPPDNFPVSFKGVRTHSILFTFEWKFW
jgi:opacity protein-like surface antigen